MRNLYQKGERSGLDQERDGTEREWSGKAMEQEGAERGMKWEWSRSGRTQAGLRERPTIIKENRIRREEIANNSR